MNKNTIGLLELNSIARGLEATDAILKAADVDLVFARPCCPGKFMILFNGMVSAVDAALQAGKKTGGMSVVDHLLIARVHPDVIKGLYCTGDIQEGGTVGVMEFFSMTAAINAADRALKSAEVSLLVLRLGIGLGGKSFAVITGDSAAVESAIESALCDPAVKGLVVDTAIMSHPSPRLIEAIC